MIINNLENMINRAILEFIESFDGKIYQFLGLKG